VGPVVVANGSSLVPSHHPTAPATPWLLRCHARPHFQHFDGKPPSGAPPPASVLGLRDSSGQLVSHSRCTRVRPAMRSSVMVGICDSSSSEVRTIGCGRQTDGEVAHNAHSGLKQVRLFRRADSEMRLDALNLSKAIPAEASAVSDRPPAVLVGFRRTSGTGSSSRPCPRRLMCLQQFQSSLTSTDVRRQVTRSSPVDTISPHD
jgi:hypothetical protein